MSFERDTAQLFRNRWHGEPPVDQEKNRFVEEMAQALWGIVMEDEKPIDENPQGIVTLRQRTPLPTPDRA